MTARIQKGDLGALREFVEGEPQYDSQASAIDAFLRKPLDLCSSQRCAEYLGISIDGLEALSTNIDEARGALLCLISWQRSEQAKSHRANDKTLLAQIDEMQKGLLPTCSPISVGSEEMLTKAFRN